MRERRHVRVGLLECSGKKQESCPTLNPLIGGMFEQLLELTAIHFKQFVLLLELLQLVVFFLVKGYKEYTSGPNGYLYP